MIKEAIEKIEGMSKPEVIEVNGAFFSKGPLHRIQVDEKPQPDVLEINTLTGLIDYIHNNLDDQEQYVVHVFDSRTVMLFGEYEPDRGRRKHYVTARFTGFNVGFGEYHQNDILTVKLMTQFEQNNDSIKSLLQIVGNVTDENATSTEDDGMTQRVTIKTGIARKGEAIISNPYMLVPRRTFAEVDIPVAPFVVRSRSGHELPEFAIFECDGGQWELDAIHAIRDYIDESLISDKNVIIIA